MSLCESFGILMNSLMDEMYRRDMLMNQNSIFYRYY